MNKEEATLNGRDFHPCPCTRGLPTDITEDNADICIGDMQTASRSEEATIADHYNYSPSTSDNQIGVLRQLGPCSNLNLQTDIEIDPVHTDDGDGLKCGINSCETVETEICTGYDLSPTDVDQETPLSVYPIAALSPLHLLTNLTEDADRVQSHQISQSLDHEEKLADAFRSIEGQQSGKLAETSEGKYALEFHAHEPPGKLEEIPVDAQNSGSSLSLGQTCAGNCNGQLAISSENDADVLNQSNVDKTNDILSDKLKSVFRKYLVTSGCLKPELWYADMSGAEAGHLGLSSENYNGLLHVASGGVQKRNSTPVMELHQHQSYDYVGQAGSTANLDMGYRPACTKGANITSHQEVVEEVLQLLVDTISCLVEFSAENKASEQDLCFESMKMGDADTNDLFHDIIKTPYMEEFTVDSRVLFILEEPDNFIVKQDVAVTQALIKPDILPNSDLGCSGQHNPDHHNSDSDVTYISRMNTHEYTSHTTQCRKSKTTHYEPENELAYDILPCKVRILEHELDFIAPCTQGSGLSPGENVKIVDQTVPCEDNAIGQAGYPSDGCSHVESFYERLITDEKEPLVLVPERLFSWKSAITLPVPDRTVPDLEVPEGQLFSLLPLKTCSKPRRVGLSRRQRLQPLHRNYRSPGAGTENRTGNALH